MNMIVSPASNNAESINETAFVGSESTAQAELFASPETTPKKKYLVVFDHIDFDSILCAWAMKHIVAKKHRAECNFIKLAHDEELAPEDTEGCEVIYVDCGGGECDHHGKGLNNSSSFKLVCEKFKLINDPSLEVLLDVSIRKDSGKSVGWDSIAHIIGIQHHESMMHPGTKDLDLALFLSVCFAIFDNYRAQARARHNAKHLFEKLERGKALPRSKIAVCETLKNGIRLAFLDSYANLRGEAFERGYDVAIWVPPANFDNREGNFTVGIASNEHSNVDLRGIAEMVRRVEMEVYRKKDTRTFANLDCTGHHPQVPGWFLVDPVDDVHRLLVCGTIKHPLTEGEFTMLSKAHILGIVRGQLEKIERSQS